MMDRFEEILEYVRQNLLMVVAVALIALLVLSFLAFTAVRIVPRWMLRSELAAQVEEAEAQLAARSGQQLGAPEALQSQIATAEADLAVAADVFLTEAQAAEVLDRLYQVAAAQGVAIRDLQAQPVPANPEKSVYDTRLFRLTAEGTLPNLAGFVGGIQDTALPSIVLQNLNINEAGGGSAADSAESTVSTAAGNGFSVLTMELVLYTSPLATGAAFDVAATPTAVVEEGEAIPLPATPTAVAGIPTPGAADLAAQLDALWTAEQWPSVIAVIEEILALDPTYPGMNEKLYAAHVNYGQQLADANQEEAARAQYEQALLVQPDGAEAQAALQALSATAAPGGTAYVVRGGDTLFSIAQRFGTSVDAIKSANGLSSNAIQPGQELVIPGS